MPNLKEVRNRINSVQSTQQITRAMKMVSAAKLRRAQDAITQMRPYAEKLEEILGNVSATLDGSSDNIYGEEREQIQNVLIIAVTSDRGLCGAFNSNVNKTVERLLKGQYASVDATVLCLGKKSRDFFASRPYNANNDYFEILQNVNFDKVKDVAEFVMQAFVEGTYDKVEVVYNEFKNVATQIVRTEQFLPLIQKEEEVSAENTVETDYIFEPSKQYIVKELIPKSLKIQLYKSVLDSQASEHGARMTAMDKATENAGELLNELKLTYNRTRQAAITTEILEIVGGAEALASGN